MKQRTIAKSITTEGIGLHSGKPVTLTFSPADVDSGIVFERTDLKDKPKIKADAFAVKDTVMSSNLVKGEAKVGTVEHLLSAVAGLGIDNLHIGVSSSEIPIMDGSAKPYISLLYSAGIKTQSEAKKFIKVLKTVEVTDGDKWAKLSPYDGYQLNFEIDFVHPVFKESQQQATLEFSTKNFITRLSRARTFGFLKDIEYMQAQNLALGGSLQNAIVLDDNRIMNEGGLRFPDEFVKHKILDAVGDLYLAGHPLLAKFDAYKSGHSLNNKLIRKLLLDPSSFKVVTEYDKEVPKIDYSLPELVDL